MPMARRTLRIAGHIVASTPLIIPAYSSAVGFKLTLESTLDETLSSVLGPILVSAYDVKPPGNGPLDPTALATRLPFAILDSGGYEMLQGATFTLERYRRVLDSWPVTLPVIAVTYDDPAGIPGGVGEQIVRAEALFARRPIGRCILLKPQSMGAHLDADDIAPHVRSLAGFDVIGITEKEAGRSMIDRLRLVTSLRRLLAEAGLDLPIHVFGGLDPFMSPLYLMAGADVFDGLSWLRYGFDRGVPIAMQSHAAMMRPDASFTEAAWATRRANLRGMGDLQIAMQKVAGGAALDELGPLHERIAAVNRQALDRG